MVDSTASATSVTGTIADKVNASASRLADSEQTFMKLLTTQLKNQDPLSPLDSNQFTQQIVQMTGVEQQLYSNQLLQQLVSSSRAAYLAHHDTERVAFSEETAAKELTVAL